MQTNSDTGLKDGPTNERTVSAHQTAAGRLHLKAAPDAWLTGDSVDLEGWR